MLRAGVDIGPYARVRVGQPWISLGDGKKANFRGTSYSQQQCYVQALTLDPKDDAWNKLGLSLGVGESARVGSQTYTKQQCYLLALTLRCAHANARNNLEFSLSVGETAQVGNQTYSQQECYVQPLTLDPKHTHAFFYPHGMCTSATKK